MAQKKVWMTWLPGGEGAPEPDAAVSALSQVGLDVAGSHWVNDLEKAAWTELGGLLLDTSKADVWLIAGRKADFDSVRTRYGLSLVTAMLDDAREAPLPGMCVGLDFAPDPDSLPLLMRQFLCLDGTQAAWAAKVVAAAFAKPGASPESEFRFNVIAHPVLGQWFEVGPRESEWQGIMFGVAEGASITHHAVGPRGQLPEKSVLEYPTQGIKAALGDTEFTAWSVQNALGPEDSYYLKVEGFPRDVIIGPDPTSDEAEVFHLKLA